MRTTVTLDDELVREAMEFSGVREKSLLLREALKALVEREAGRRLIRAGGTMPNFKLPPRDRTIR